MNTIIKSYRLLLVAISTTVLLAGCDKDDLNPKPNLLAPGAGASNTLLTLTGTGIGKVRTIYFETDSVVAPFNTNFNTNDALLFRVPTDAVPGQQLILFKNVDGTEFSVPFNVLGFATITDASDYNFTQGTQITLTGKNLADVTAVNFSGTAEPVTVVSSTPTTLVLEFGASTISRSRLDITNAAGITATTQEFVNLDKATKLFTDDYAPGYQDASWGDAGFVSTTVFKRGTASFGKKFAAGNWHQMGFGWTNTADSGYTYLSFWARGGSADYKLYISSQQSATGFANTDETNAVLIPANVWTYFKVPLATLKLWNKGATWNQIGWRIKGPDGSDETFYLDDVLLVK